jgi:bacteriophage N4 adsorption protein B
VISHIPSWLQPLDRAVLWALAPLAIILLISGLDDLEIDLAWIYAWLAGRFTEFLPGEWRRNLAPPRRIAIFVPLWQEHAVVDQMLEHNLAALRYPGYHIFAGAYPNDELTQNAVKAIADRFPNVHLAVCPHDGPTSKADCLNWIYQHVGLYEEQTGERFDLVVTHDAEDLIHPDELQWINFYASRYDFVQIPVLAVATRRASLTYGVFCDEFAEYHTRDMAVRSQFHCFVPGAGVGTGYRREALEKLARAASNRVFEPRALTEDYENGLRLFRLGCAQTFVPLMRSNGPGSDFIATRELFPDCWKAALRQRTRWVIGICFQSWERYGWGRKWSEVYWLWRDRKGLIGSPLGVIANAIFFYGLATALWTRTPPWVSRLALATLAVQVWRLAVRMLCVARIYGVWFSLGVPIRAVYANALNAAAVVQAAGRYALARIRRQALPWLKTDHSYPSRAALLPHKRKLGEILAGSGYLSASAVKQALAMCPAGERLGEYLVRLGSLTEESLYEALSLQQGLSLTHLNPSDVPPGIARALPLSIARSWRVLPFRVAGGSLFLAGPDLPTPEMTTALRSFTSLELRFHLLMPSEYEKLAETLL